VENLKKKIEIFKEFLIDEFLTIYDHLCKCFLFHNFDDDFLILNATSPILSFWICWPFSTIKRHLQIIPEKSSVKA